MRLLRGLSDFMDEFPEAITASDAYRATTFNGALSNPWNPITSMSPAPKDLLITME